MALEAPEPGWTWLTIPKHDAIDVVVIGDVQTWHTHWVVPPGGRRPSAVRCTHRERGSCHLCEAHHERRTRYVIPVLHEGQPRLLEVGRVQYPALAVAHEIGEWIGTRFRCLRERPHSNAPIVMRSVGHETVPADRVVDITEYVSVLGTDTLRLFPEEPAALPRTR